MRRGARLSVVDRAASRLEVVGPRGFTTTTHVMDVRPGGEWRFVMHGPDGTNYKNRIVYIEVVPPERLVYKHAGEEGDEPVRFHVTVTFAAEAGKTRLTTRMVFDTPEERTLVAEKYGAVEGLRQTLESTRGVPGERISSHATGSFTETRQGGCDERSASPGGYAQRRVRVECRRQAPAVGRQWPPLRGLGNLSSEGLPR